MQTSRQIRWACVDQGCVILDLRAGRYIVLDDVGTFMWRALLGAMAWQEAKAIVQLRYAVDAEILERDLQRFSHDCLRRGFVTIGGEPETPPSSRHAVSASPGGSLPLPLRALQCLLQTRRQLHGQGFSECYERLQTLTTNPAALGGEDPDPILRKACRSFLHLESLMISRRAPEDCLERSMALYRLLLGSGLPAEHVIGVRLQPFLAHAWVECNGEPLLGERRHGFTPLARLTPAR